MRESTYCVIGSVGVALVVGIFLSFLFTRWERKKFVTGKLKMSDAEFLKPLGLEDMAADLALALRGRLASMISVPREMLHQDDSMCQIRSCRFGDWDPLYIVMFIEEFWMDRGFEIDLGPDFGDVLYKGERETLGEYLCMAVLNSIDYLPKDIVLPTDSGNELTL